MRNCFLVATVIFVFCSCKEDDLNKLSNDICLSCSQPLKHIIGKDTVLIPTIITPNGDNYDDYFRIANLNKYPANSLIIYDRNKNKIAEFSPYNNDWNGHYNSKVYGNGLYYYQLTLDMIAAEGSFLSLGNHDSYYNIKILSNSCGINCTFLDPNDPFIE